ncbi:DUF11 domain-containing protein [Actinomadura barringtoniae]|uniref:DUF11 domain-containing protein n=1 Tax=Actinomadura barringtoniae TaxID=1427535 RepID=A0A939PMT6_9ACTN|nr:DUF11 domain-containing protein [Actinomadura barringtoniae]MBO2451456.1 DUF11 domain-containing protein [Actinomadura barringtoniae]
MKRSAVIASAVLAATVLTPTAYALAHTEADPVSDLGVTLAGPTSTALPGETVTYQATVHNAGPDAAPSIEISTAFTGPKLSMLDMNGFGGFCTQLPGRTACLTNDALPSGATKVIKIQARVDPHALPGTVGLTTKVSGRQASDPDQAGNSAQAQFTVGSAADLGVTLSGPQSVKRNNWISYEVKAANRGGLAATNGKVALRLPGGVSFKDAPIGCAVQGSDVTCDLGDLAVNGAKSFKVDARVDADVPFGRRLDAQAHAKSDLYDAVPADNTVVSSATVAQPTPPPAPPKANVAITGKASALRKGRTGTYALVVTNKGPNAAKNVVVTGALPKGMTFKSVRGCKRFKNGIKCTIPNLKAGGKVTITMNVTVVKGAKSGSRTFVVIARSATKDPVTSNNVARIKRSITK